MQALQSSTSTEIQIPRAFDFLTKPKRYKILYGGRGGAKSHNIARTLLVIGMEKPLRIICCREIQKSIDDSVHALLCDIIKQYGLEWFYEIQKTKIIGKNGTEVKYRGLKHNTTDLKSLEGADRLWIEEAENVSHNSYEIVIPTVRKEGSEIWVSFNPKNPTDPTWMRFIQSPSERVVSKKVSWRDNPFFPQVLEDERLELLQTDKEAYNHVWEGEFDTRYSGAVYAKYVKSEQISENVKHDPEYPVYTAWDKGYGDATAIVFYQIGNGEVYIIDYFEDNQEFTKYYCERLYGREIIVGDRDLETGDVKNWTFGEDLPGHEHRRAYRYHAHFSPHDTLNKVMEGRSIVTQAGWFGIKMMDIKACSHRDSEEALRTTLPKCWINKDRCQDLIQSLMTYHYEYDEDRQRYSKLPYHDWSSNGCDAAEIMARTWMEAATTVKELDRRQLVSSFHSKRIEHNLVQEDPYRLRSKR